MVKKDSPNKQDWLYLLDTYVLYGIGYGYFRNRPKIGKIFFSIAEKEQRKFHRRLIESEIKTEIKKVIKNTLINAGTLRIRDKTENLISKTSFWIPRKYREAIVGDILEDCHELRALGKSEWRIRIHIIWQLIIGLILLRPTVLVDALKRMLSTK